MRLMMSKNPRDPRIDCRRNRIAVFICGLVLRILATREFNQGLRSAITKAVGIGL